MEEVVRKRGYLKTKENERKPISDNVIVEELLGEAGIICVEDVIDALWSCKREDEPYQALTRVLWPI